MEDSVATAPNLARQDLQRAVERGLVDNEPEESAPAQGQIYSSLVQWQKNGGDVYLPMGPTADRLPSGAYKPQYLRGVLGLKAQDIQTDSLLALLSSPVSRVLASIEDFWERRDGFEKRGMVYKRGILLWGPPGGGKTAAIGIVCKRVVERGGIVIVDDGPSTVQDALQLLRQVEGAERPIVHVVEDLERFFDKESHELPFLLSILDGQAQVQNIVHLATTNSPEVADDRVIKRPSRFDEIVEVGAMEEGARESYIRHHAGADLSEEEISKWVKCTNGLPIAFVKEMVISVLCLGRNFEETAARLREMLKAPKGYGVKKAGEVGLGPR